MDVQRDQLVTMVRKVKINCLPCLAFAILELPWELGRVSDLNYRDCAIITWRGGRGVGKLEGGIGENDNKREGGWM